GLDLLIAIPLLALVFIAANVQVSVREKIGHFAEKSIQKFVSLLARRIERRLKDSSAPFDLVRSRGTAEFGMANQPTGAVAGDVELRHDANAAIARVGNNLAHLILRIEQPIGPQCV